MSSKKNELASTKMGKTTDRTVLVEEDQEFELHPGCPGGSVSLEFRGKIDPVLQLNIKLCCNASILKALSI